jgi:hypothetical protein
MFAHTGEFPRFAESTPSLKKLGGKWIALVLASTAIGIAAARERADTPRVATPPGTVLSFARRASHDRRYLAEVVATSATPAVNAPQSWEIEIRRRNHRRLANATVTARLWMPEARETMPTMLHATYVGRGRYRLSGLVLSRPGWWNIDLAIDGMSGRDSVAFNVIIPSRATDTTDRLRRDTAAARP